MPPAVVPTTISSGTGFTAELLASRNAIAIMLELRWSLLPARVGGNAFASHASGTCPAVLHLVFETSKPVTSVTASRATRREFRFSSVFAPSGETTPIPVTSTRRLAVSAWCLEAIVNCNESVPRKNPLQKIIVQRTRNNKSVSVSDPIPPRRSGDVA
jgi:hypothetical protein